MPENSSFSSEVNVAGLQGLRITSFHLWAVRPWMLQGSSGRSRVGHAGWFDQLLLVGLLDSIQFRLYRQ